ncbi:MAG: cyclic dehypoxanthinyl futalosine synthase [Planctomycetota bacterium]
MPGVPPTCEELVHQIEEKIGSGARLTREEAEALFEVRDITQIGALADLARRRKHPDRVVTYIVDRNINPTNVCVARCKFCAFDRLPGDPEGYLLTDEEIFAKIDELLRIGGIQILLQGGHHPRLGVEYYERLFSEIKKRYRIHVHALSPPEVIHLARVSKVSVREALERLRAAGLDSIPGGGAEILVERVRRLISPHKATTAQWLKVMREAHRLGMRTTATMMFGHVETVSDRVEHLLRIRELQDETHGFTAFICWTFQPGGSELDLPKAGPYDYLRTLAISRLVLDNVENLQTSFVTQGPKIGQLGLFFGANDFGSAMLEENVVRSAGTDCLMTVEEIERAILDAGFVPARRTMTYERLGEPGPTTCLPPGDSRPSEGCGPAGGEAGLRGGVTC